MPYPAQDKERIFGDDLQVLCGVFVGKIDRRLHVRRKEDARVLGKGGFQDISSGEGSELAVQGQGDLFRQPRGGGHQNGR